MTRRIAFLVPVSLALSACAGPETRVRTALQDAGLSKPMASCMAERMVDRLSLFQLNRLRGLKKLKGAETGNLSVEEFLKRTQSLQDPEIFSVVSSSGVVCAIKTF